MQIKIKKLDERAIVPQYATDGAAGFDFHAMMPSDSSHALVSPGTPTIFDTGLSFEIPAENVMLIFSRSGHGFNKDIRLANCVGVIDSDYRGEVKVKLTSDNSDGQWLDVRHGDRIAQGVIVPVHRAEFVVVDELSSTERGEGGFGSTGTGQ